MQQQEPSSRPSQKTPSSKKRGPRTTHASQPPQTPPVPRPSVPQTPEKWRAHWKTNGQPWRTEPEIDVERQKELTKRRVVVPSIEKGIYPFAGMKLTRADIEWLLTTHENGRGPIDWNDESQREREGLDLRGTDLHGSNLAGLPLARLVGGIMTDWSRSTTKEQRRLTNVMLTGANLTSAHLEGANLTSAHLEGANLIFAQMEEANLFRVYLERAELERAHLERANLDDAHLESANLDEAHLEGASLRGANLEQAFLNGAYLKNTDLRWANLEGATLNAVTLAGKDHIGPHLVDIRWSTTHLTGIDWSQVTFLGEEYEARQKRENDGSVKKKWPRLCEFQEAVRANRQLSVVLRDQGLNEDAARFAYRAQVLQKTMYWFQIIQDSISLRQRANALGNWLFSWFLFLLAGYGYKPLRSFLAYLLVITGFATIYYLFGLNDLVGLHQLPGPHYLSWYEAFVVSMTAFHGRGFFVGTFSPADPQALVAAIEAFFGLLIEVTFIATLTQRLFNR